MADDLPSLDQLEDLLAADPNRFPNLLQTQRAIDAARSAHWTAQDGLVRAQYQQYLDNGGTPIGPNGEMPPRTDSLDQEFGSASCNCGAQTPCCLTELIFNCSHGNERMRLPLPEGSEADPILVLVTDQAGQPTIHDQITVDPVITPSGTCRMEQKNPILRVTGEYTGDFQLGDDVSWKVPYGDASRFGGSNFSRFATATRYTIFGDIIELHNELELEVLSCARRADLNAMLQVYPKVEWASDGFFFEIKGTFQSNFTFIPEVTLGGSLEGTFHDSTFKVGAEVSTDDSPAEHKNSIVPFLDTVLEKMKSLTGQSSGRTTGSETRSTITVKHKFALGKSKFNLAEHPSDHSQVGIEAQLDIGYAPFLGITAEIDVIDVILTAAQTVPAAAVFARTLRKARDIAAEGYGDDNSAVEASAHVALKLSASAEVGGGVVLTRSSGDDAWQGAGKVEGKIQFSLIGLVRAEGRVYAVEGAFSAEGEAMTDVTGTVITLTQSESRAANGAKLKTTIKWGGLKVKYKAVARLRAIIANGSSQAAGELPVLSEETWYEKIS